MNKLYREDIKEKFLNTYDNEQTQKTLRHVFYKSELIEDTLDKDLYNFNMHEIAKVIKNANPHNEQTARSIGRFISNYISWAIGEGLRENNINPIKGIDNSFYEPLVDKTKKIHYSYDEFLLLLEDMQNGQDQAFLSLIFEGVMGKSFSQLRELTVSDVKFNTNEIYIKERDKTINVSTDTMKYLEKAINQPTFYTFNKETKEHNEKPLVESEYVFRNVMSPRTQAGMVNPSVFYTRNNNLKEEFELEYLTPNAIKQSGMIKMAADLFEEYGKLDYEQFAVIGEKYDFSKVKTVSAEYYNTTLMREFISEKNLKELYNIDIEF